MLVGGTRPTCLPWLRPGHFATGTRRSSLGCRKEGFPGDLEGARTRFPAAAENFVRRHFPPTRVSATVFHGFRMASAEASHMHTHVDESLVRARAVCIRHGVPELGYDSGRFHVFIKVADAQWECFW